MGETKATGATRGGSSTVSDSLNGLVVSVLTIFGERNGFVLTLSEDEKGLENLVSLGEVGEKFVLEENGLKGLVLYIAVGVVAFLSARSALAENSDGDRGDGDRFL